MKISPFVFLSAVLSMLFLSGCKGHEDINGHEFIGFVKAKNSSEINNSPWGIQAGTLNSEILERASEIGVKWTRLGASWNEIEKEPGIYTWDKTDKAFSAALEKGITPFVTIGGTNKLYCEKRSDLDPKLEEIYGNKPLPPTSNPKAMKAWLEFAAKVVERYKDKIKYWEVWNEPNHFAYWGDEPNGKEYGRLLRETAKVIKSIDPNCYVLGGSMAGLDPDFTEAFLSVGTSNLIDIITYHNYGAIPEERIYPAVKVWDVINKYNPQLKLWQGECGYPSHSSTRDYRGISPWGPMIQAKWLLRQAFTDTYFCKSELSNYFKLFHRGGRGQIPKRSFLTSIDSILGYPERGGSRVKVVGVNEKCLFENPSLNPKPGFFAYQNLCAVMDGRYKRTKNKTEVIVKDTGIFYGIGEEDDAFPSVPLVACYKTKEEKNLLAYWLPWHPQELIKTATVNVIAEGVDFKEPVYVNLLTGEVYQLKSFEKYKNLIRFYNMPLADYPFVIIERNEITLQ